MKIYIFGPPSSGKTTIGKELSLKFSIPFYELDKIFLKKEKNGFTDIVKERCEMVERIVHEKSWIIEGMYSQDWIDNVLAESDYIFVLKISDFVLNSRIIFGSLKKMAGPEKLEKESSIKHLWQHVNFNLFRYGNHKKELLEKLKNSGKKAKVVKSIDEIFEHITENKVSDG